MSCSGLQVTEGAIGRRDPPGAQRRPSPRQMAGAGLTDSPQKPQMSQKVWGCSGMRQEDPRPSPPHRQAAATGHAKASCALEDAVIAAQGPGFSGSLTSTRRATTWLHLT